MTQQVCKTGFFVVGGGMVGATAALGLARLGHSVTVVEPAPVTEWSVQQPYDLRISAVTADNIAMLKEFGVWDEIAQLRAQPFLQLAVREQRTDWLELGQADSEHPLGYMVENQLLQYVLWKALQAQPKVTLVNGTVTKLDCISCTAETSDGQHWQYDWLLGCDGAASLVRKHSGIGVWGRSYGESCLLAIVKADKAVAPRTWESFAGAEIHALLPLAEQHACLILYAASPVINKWQRDDTELFKQLQQRFNGHIGTFELLRHGSFPLTRQSALHYTQGRTILLGDAAHAIHPMAGQGVNLGFRDVRQLIKNIGSTDSENIARIQQALGWYRVARRADNELMAHAMDGIGYGFKTNSTPLQVMRRGILQGLRIFTPGRNLMTAYASGVWKIKR